MTISNLLASALLATVAGSAWAGDWLPTAGLRLEFGTARGAHCMVSVGTAWNEPTLPLPLPLTQLSFDSHAGVGGMLLGMALKPQPRGLHQDEGAIVEESTQTSYNWAWVALGVAVLASTVEVSKSDEENNGNNDGDDDFGGCNIASTNGNTVYVAGPNCPVVGDLHFPP